MNNFTTALHDEKTFYKAFLSDLDQATEEIIIESPFITSYRMRMLWPALRRAYSKGIKVYVITRDPNDHSDGYELQSEYEIEALEALGIQVLLFTSNHHRKLPIIVRKILWEGSLNILSQTRSREIMRRLDGGGFAVDMFNYLNLGRYI